MCRCRSRYRHPRGISSDPFSHRQARGPLSSIAKEPTWIPGCYYCVAMFEASPTSTSNFRSIFVAALDKYKERTKTDLLTHPLATRLQSCNSSSDILAVLHDKVNEFDQSRSHTKRLLIWLNPIINVLYAFSTTLGDGVGLVRLKWLTHFPCSHTYFHRYSHLQK